MKNEKLVISRSILYRKILHTGLKSSNIQEVEVTLLEANIELGECLHPPYPRFGEATSTSGGMI